MSAMFPIILPPTTSADQLVFTMRQQGYVVMAAKDVRAWLNGSSDELERLNASWHHLPLDHYLKDGGRYRRRRHSCFVAYPDRVEQTAHRAHWQPLVYNALHGGMVRLFEPVVPQIVALGAWQNLLQSLAKVCNALKGEQPWYIEAHQFRIDTIDGIGRPTPEGAHRDGVDFVAVIMVQRVGVKGGETRVFESAGTGGRRFTLIEPWTLLLLDDEKVIHESTPIQPFGDDCEHSYRDTLVLTFRRHGFQGMMEQG